MKDNKVVRFAVIGSGKIGRSHMRGCIANHNSELVAISDPDVARLNETAEMYFIDKDRIYTDWREMLKRDDIDAVIVATPDQCHAENTFAALESGRHVLCEKPFALSREDCQAMIQAGWCGVNLLATAHAATVDDLLQRPVYKPILESGLFQNVIVLKQDKSWEFKKVEL